MSFFLWLIKYSEVLSSQANLIWTIFLLNVKRHNFCLLFLSFITSDKSIYILNYSVSLMIGSKSQWSRGEISYPLAKQKHEGISAKSKCRAINMISELTKMYVDGVVGGSCAKRNLKYLSLHIYYKPAANTNSTFYIHKRKDSTKDGLSPQTVSLFISFKKVIPDLESFQNVCF